MAKYFIRSEICFHKRSYASKKLLNLFYSNQNQRKIEINPEPVNVLPQENNEHKLYSSKTVDWVDLINKFNINSMFTVHEGNLTNSYLLSKAELITVDNSIGKNIKIQKVITCSKLKFLKIRILLLEELVGENLQKLKKHWHVKTLRNKFIDSVLKTQITKDLDLAPYIKYVLLLIHFGINPLNKSKENDKQTIKIILQSSNPLAKMGVKIDDDIENKNFSLDILNYYYGNKEKLPKKSIKEQSYRQHISSLLRPLHHEDGSSKNESSCSSSSRSSDEEDNGSYGYKFYNNYNNKKNKYETKETKIQAKKKNYFNISYKKPTSTQIFKENYEMKNFGKERRWVSKIRVFDKIKDKALEKYFNYLLQKVKTDQEFSCLLELIDYFILFLSCYVEIRLNNEKHKGPNSDKNSNIPPITDYYSSSEKENNQVKNKDHINELDSEIDNKSTNLDRIDIEMKRKNFKLLRSRKIIYDQTEASLSSASL